MQPITNIICACRRFASGQAIAVATVLLSIWVSAAPSYAQTQYGIDWSVHNRFRLFTNEDSVVLKENELLTILRNAKNIKAAYSQYYPLLQGARGQLNLYEHTHYNRDPGDYSPSRDGEELYVTPNFQQIDAHLTGLAGAARRCSWLVDGKVVLRDRPCTAPAVLNLPFPQGQFTYAGAIAVESEGQVLASQSIQTSDVLIVAMGDSYGAGEGSPDRPTDVTKMVVGTPFDAGKPYAWWRSAPGQTGALPEEASADWWSPECHRSLFSPQVLAALKLAADDTHRSVTYLSYSCAGAAVLDGLLTPQAQPPGLQRIALIKTKDGSDGIEGQAAERSQLERAVADLCETPLRKEPYDLESKSAQIPNWLKVLYDRAQGEDPDIPVCDHWKRHPSYVFLTIGGNDVGFAGLATWALTPEDIVHIEGAPGVVDDFFTSVVAKLAGDFASWNGMQIVCPTQPYRVGALRNVPLLNRMPVFDHNDPRCARYPQSTNMGAQHLIEQELPTLLNIAQVFFKTSGLLDSAVVIQEAYPMPLKDQNGLLCGTFGPPTSFASEAQLAEPWLANKAQLPDLISNIDVYVRREAAGAVEEKAFVPGKTSSLLGQLQAAQIPGKWVLAQSPADFVKHGVCAGSADPADSFVFPRGSGAAPPADIWQAGGAIPANWKAYQPRQRWLRTSDDSLLTEAVSSKGEILDESLSGAVHPTAEGQAAVADELYRAIPQP